jgi:hypothetical protein
VNKQLCAAEAHFDAEWIIHDWLRTSSVTIHHYLKKDGRVARKIDFFVELQ